MPALYQAHPESLIPLLESRVLPCIFPPSPGMPWPSLPQQAWAHRRRMCLYGLILGRIEIFGVFSQLHLVSISVLLCLGPSESWLIPWMKEKIFQFCVLLFYLKWKRSHNLSCSLHWSLDFTQFICQNLMDLFARENMGKKETLIISKYVFKYLLKA